MGQLCCFGTSPLSASWPLYRFEEIDSTNTEAKRRAAEGSFNNQWIVASTQTAGRGRQDRAWSSPVGNIFTTALFAEPGGISVALRVPFAAALAVVDTVLSVAPAAPVRVKWPNDVRVDHQKVSGILVETGGAGDRLWIAAGTGINVAYAPDNVGQGATSLNRLSAQVLDLKEVLDFYHSAFEARLAQAKVTFDGVRKDWLKYAEGRNEKVSVRVGDTYEEGVFEDLEQDGALRLRLPDGSARIIRAGEVNLIGRA
ncbi:biotin--acetyl-CoA-carboxylase ligase [Hyphomonas neptunium ATCC 15444]|uniref:biotin--[biotin carboxyl-carrier protein] ligase n=1 Tax=Hyphomonas neptunium (strain ATCC 15444) TaxID=228405 RepID=Q0C1D0_HYPNA|nr:biotin--acetyl-CoA-carboxylase ligase [Hyphomonas neptunium ATCC 15444]